MKKRNPHKVSSAVFLGIGFILILNSQADITGATVGTTLLPPAWSSLLGIISLVIGISISIVRPRKKSIKKKKS